MPQYEFAEVRFLAHAHIQKVTKAVKRFVFFDGTEESWPTTIDYDIVAVLQGTTTAKEAIVNGQGTLVSYGFMHEYGRAAPSRVSIEDMTSGRLGNHVYYSLDLSDVQPHIMRYLNALGQKGWELVSAPPALGTLKLRFDIEQHGPGVARIDFPGGDQQVYVGQSNNTPTGYAYSLKRAV